MAARKTYRTGRAAGALIAAERTAGAEAVQAIRRGFAWSAAEGVQRAYGLNDATFARLVGVSARTLARHRRRARPLDAVASDRLYRVRRAMEMAERVFGDRARAVSWMSRAHFGLAWKVPLEMLDTEPGAQAVILLLGQIEYGVLP